MAVDVDVDVDVDLDGDGDVDVDAILRRSLLPGTQGALSVAAMSIHRVSLDASIERLQTGLDYHVQRHNLLTANLAHVDTPGYQPLDLERKPAFHQALSSALVATEPGHIGTVRRTEPFRVIVDPTATAGMDGNAVSVDREAVKIASNNVRYEALGTLIGDQLAQLRWAANDGRSG